MRVAVRIPATTANVGPGFDSFGMALELYNTLVVETAQDGLDIVATGSGHELIPLSEENSVYHSIRTVFERVKQTLPGLRIHIHNEVPVTRGLGSSATAIVGGLVAGNALCGYPLSDAILLELAVAIEGHPDNVAAALFGGFVISGTIDRQVYGIPFTPPSGLKAVVAIPEFPLSTIASRGVLPKFVPFRDAVSNLNAAGLMVAALARGDLALLGKAMRDKLHEPYRLSLIPGARAAVDAASRNGALGVALSGSGPTLIALCTSDPQRVAEAMVNELHRVGVPASFRVLNPALRGAEVVDEHDIAKS